MIEEWPECGVSVVKERRGNIRELRSESFGVLDFVGLHRLWEGFRFYSELKGEASESLE